MEVLLVMEDVEEHNIFEEPKRSMPSSQEELMASHAKIPVNRDRNPPPTDASWPANPAASGSQIPPILLTTNPADSGSQIPSITLTSEALQWIIDYIGRNGGAHPSALSSQSGAVDNMNYAHDFTSFNPPAFDGSSDDLDVADEWIMDLEAIFDFLQFQDEQRVRSAVFMLKGNARYWWKLVKPAQDDDGAETLVSWQEFKDMFLDRYYPETVRDKKEIEFLTLRQGNMTVYEYERKFERLSHFAPELVDTELKMARRFVMGLRKEIKGPVAIECHTDYSSACRSAQILDEFMSVRSQPGQDHGSSGQKRKHQQIS